MRIRSRRAVLARAQADVVQFEKRLHRLHPAVSDMPLQETPEQRQDRRSAIKTICRLSTALEHPDQLSRDAGGAILAERVTQLREAAWLVLGVL